MALQPGSLAIDAGGSGGVATDQRGFNRVENGQADIGAVESEAPSLIVTTSADIVDNSDQVTSLREAVTLANSQAGADTITFDAGVFDGIGANSVIRLVQGELDITDQVTIDGSTGTGVVVSGDVNGDDVLVAGAYITDVTGSGSFNDENSRVFNFSAAGADGSQINNLTITGGRATSNAHGGGILSVADLTIIDSTIAGTRQPDRLETVAASLRVAPT